MSEKPLIYSKISEVMENVEAIYMKTKLVLDGKSGFLIQETVFKKKKVFINTVF